MRHIEAIERRDPNFMPGELMVMRGDRNVTDAVKDFETAIKDYTEGAAIFKEQGKIPKAIECLIKAGAILEKNREFDKAIATYKKILKMDKNDFQGLMKLGMIQIRNNQKDKGMKNLEAAYEKNKGNVELKIKLAETYARGDDEQINKAEKMLQEALILNKGSGDAFAALGRIYERKEKVDDAINAYHRALQLPHSNNSIYFNIGLLHEKKKQPADAIKFYK